MAFWLIHILWWNLKKFIIISNAGCVNGLAVSNCLLMQPRPTQTLTSFNNLAATIDHFPRSRTRRRHHHSTPSGDCGRRPKLRRFEKSHPNNKKRAFFIMFYFGNLSLSIAKWPKRKAWLLNIVFVRFGQKCGRFERRPQ